MKYISIIAGLILASCGANKRASELKDDLPDNYAIKTACYALNDDLKQPIKVSSDDSSDIRVCANVQKDGHVGLDLRYQNQQKVSPYPIFALVTLQDGKGRNASEMFRMQSNPFSGAFELYLTDGCLVGSFGGCAQSSQKKMQQLFEVLNNRERDGNFELSLAFVAIKGEPDAQWDLHNSLRKQSYKFQIKDL